MRAVSSISSLTRGAYCFSSIAGDLVEILAHMKFVCRKMFLAFSTTPRTSRPNMFLDAFDLDDLLGGQEIGAGMAAALGLGLAAGRTIADQATARSTQP